MSPRRRPAGGAWRAQAAGGQHQAAARRAAPARSPRSREPAGSSPSSAPPASLNVGPEGGRSPLNTGGLIYGTIVAAAAVAIGSVQGDTPGDIVNALVSTVLIYWLAHVYTATLSGRRPESGQPLPHRAWASARHEAPILLGGLPSLLVTVALWAAGLSVVALAAVALAIAIGMLAVEGFLAARQAGISGWRLPLEILGAALFGGLIGGLMVILHI